MSGKKMAAAAQPLVNKESDPFKGWSFGFFRLEQVVYVLCFLANLTALIVQPLVFDNRVFTMFDWYMPVYDATNGSAMYMQTEFSSQVIGVNSYMWFTLFILIFNSVIYSLVICASPSRVFMDVTSISIPQLRKREKATPVTTTATDASNSRFTSLILTHYTSDNYGFLYQYIMRCVSWPLIAAFTLYLLGQQSGSVLYGTIALMEFLNLIIFASESALDSLCLRIERMVHDADAASNDPPVSKDGKPVKEYVHLWGRSPLQTSLPILIVTIWILLLVVLFHPFRVVMTTADIPAEFISCICVFIGSVALASISLCANMFIIFMYALWRPGHFYDNSCIIRWKIHTLNILMHLYDTFMPIFILLFSLQYVLVNTTGSVIL